MIEIKLILLLVIAHLLSDFIFQPQAWSDRKLPGFSPYIMYIIWWWWEV